MPKSKKKRELNPDKFRTTLYLDKDLVGFAKEKRLKLSGFLNAALNRVRKLNPKVEDVNSLNLDVLLKIDPENSLKQWTRGDSNARTSPCQGDVIAS